MPLKEVVETLLEKNSMETKITLERNIDVRVSPDGSIGANLVLQFDGLTVSTLKEDGPAYAAGLRSGDLIMDINGNSTRYMPLKRCVELIKKSKDGIVNLIVRREVIMWGKGGV